MKIFVFVLLLAIPGALHAQQKTYTLTGKIAGKSDGMKVYLARYDWESQAYFDSSVIRKGKFVMKGRMDVPRLIRLIIDRTPKGQVRSEKNWVQSSFYLENSNIGFSAHIDSMPSYYYNPKKITADPVIAGSRTQDESNALKATMAPLKKELRVLDEEYLKVYHRPAIEGKFNTKEGVELSRKMNAVSDSLDNMKWDYIRQHPASKISYDLAMDMLKGMYVTLTLPRLNELERLVRKGWDGTKQMQQLQEAVTASKRTAIGERYLDFSFYKPDGQKVMLSELMPKGKYVLLEFWASWCGPCRGEIPHLREANKNKKDNFEIISISLD
ncbi:MAG: AhpC/TSA family protein, partial [Chitinophagaceae bacterium]|nr:AhpC/TSA family protein [Chitinophagaceae bacterium]